MGVFDSVGGLNPKRSAFDLSHENKLSCNMGDLVPFLCQEVVPGDTFRINAETMIRFAPMLAPIMHRVDVFTHFFFVPNRLIMDKWQDFITGGLKGNDESVLPKYDFSADEYMANCGQGSLSDYLGLPTFPSGTTFATGWHRKINLMPHRAYQLICNEYYLDQNLQEPYYMEKIQVVSGSEMVSLTKLRKRAWEKDYFTSCLPNAQKGAPVQVENTGTNADYRNVTLNPNVSLPGYFTSSDHTTVISGTTAVMVKGEGVASPHAPVQLGTDASHNLQYDPNMSLRVNVAGGGGIFINDLREAMQLQKWLERNMRAGSRYIESILSHFGVKSSDARLQRPEYLGGGKCPVQISEVLQTSQTTENSPQATMAGHGVAVGNSNSFKAFFEEHGYVIGIMSVMPRTAYYQGTPRHFLRDSKLDFYWPEFAHLGEQPVYYEELYTSNNVANPNTSETAPFGYQGRYNEYRYIPSGVHGDFRTTLSFWHMARHFADTPALNESFILAQPTTDIFAVTDPTNHHLWCNLYINFQAVRPMPYLADPGFVDHF